MSALDWLRDKLGLETEPEPPEPDYGYPSPLLVGRLIGILTDCTPAARRDGNRPEHTPVKVHMATNQPGVAWVRDVAYVGFNTNTEEIVLTLREDS